MILTQEMGLAQALSNPQVAALAAQHFQRRQFRRGPLRARYLTLSSDIFARLDANNRAHIRAALAHAAREYGCSVSDLGWAISDEPVANGLYLVLVKRWEDIERMEHERRKTESNA